jgi:hypothetical protein
MLTNVAIYHTRKGCPGRGCKPVVRPHGVVIVGGEIRERECFRCAHKRRKERKR